MPEEALRITSIEEQVKDPERRSIFVNGRFALGLAREVVLAKGLRVGQVITERELEELARAETVRQARESAYLLLSYRARTEGELRHRLNRKGYPEDVVEQVIASMIEQNLVNDARFSRDWVESRLRSRPMGKKLMVWELRRKGIDPETVAESTEAIGPEAEEQMAMDLGRAKLERMHEPDLSAKRRRLASLLRRRGFSWETVHRVLDELLPSEESVE